MITKTDYDRIFVANDNNTFFSASENHGNTGMGLPPVWVCQVSEVSRTPLLMSTEGRKRCLLPSATDVRRACSSSTEKPVLTGIPWLPHLISTLSLAIITEDSYLLPALPPPDAHILASVSSASAVHRLHSLRSHSETEAKGRSQPIFSAF